MNSCSDPKHPIEPVELVGFKEKTDALLNFPQQNDMDKVLKCIKDLNRINDQGMFNIIGKITRGLHTAIADLNESSHNTQNSRNLTRAGLDYVISITEQAAKTTLDMTEDTQAQLAALAENLATQNAMLDQSSGAASSMPSWSDLHTMVIANQQTVDNISRNITEIVLAQNFQDLTSQSLTKVSYIISDVENSLVALTQYTNLLQQLSRYSDATQYLDSEDTRQLRSRLEKIELTIESEHMDQDEVDTLLSSLGF